MRKNKIWIVSAFFTAAFALFANKRWKKFIKK